MKDTKTTKKQKVLGRVEAVHARCLDCSGFIPNDRLRCKMKECPLHPFRASSVKPKKGSGISRAKAVQMYCLDCSGGSAQERMKCPSVNCPLHPYRNAEAIRATKASLGGVLDD